MKKLLILLLVLTLLFAVAGCNGTSTPTATAEVPSTSAADTSATVALTPTPEPIVLKYAQLGKETDPQGITMLAFAEKIKELSGGLITCETYASGSLYTQSAEVAAIISGELDISHINFQDISTYLPEAGMFAAPYTITSYETMEKVFASDTIKQWYQKVSDACGFTPIGYVTQGVRTVNTKQTDPVMTPENLKGINLRMPSGETWTHIGQSLGANVVSVAYAELYTALQTGLCDAQDNPYANDVASKLYEVTKQISVTNHLIDIVPIEVSNKRWNTLTDQQKEWMYEAADYAGKQGSQATYDGEAANLKIMTDFGLFVTEPDIEAFATYSHQYYTDNNLTSSWNMDLYNAVQAIK